MILNFAKYHGAGNDFIMIDNRTDNRHIWDALTPESIATLCQRNLGIGADGIILAVKPGGDVPYSMGYFNSDGTPAEMCGNGLRCLMQFLADLGEPVREMPEVKIMTGAGVVAARFTGEGKIQVSMPVPQFNGKAAKIKVPGETVNIPIEVPGMAEPIHGTAAGVGNPHFVIYNNEMWEGDEVHEIGFRLMHHKDLFPEGVNVGFARKEADDTCALVVYERGVGPTLACGSGAIAAIGAGVAEGRWRFETPINVRMPGGELKVTIGPEWSYAVLEGDAVRVFEGTVEV
ncbi:diaminopimelate epimerase [bacterium]|nr:diaminopimelate epimerase [bacterium]